MTTDVDRPAELFLLDRPTCIALLTTQHVGRLVFGGGEPSVVPVNYRSVDGVITFRTRAGSPAGESASGPVVFEVDMFDERTRAGWSVVARGALRCAPEGEPAAALESWAPGARDQWMVLTVDTVTGRLLRGAVAGDSHAAAGYL